MKQGIKNQTLGIVLLIILALLFIGIPLIPEKTIAHATLFVIAIYLLIT